MKNYNKFSLVYALQLFFFIGLGIYLIFFGQWEIQTNLLSLMPQSAQYSSMQQAEQHLFNDKKNQVVVLISGDNAVSAYKRLAKELTNNKSATLIENTLPTIKEISQFYQPYRNNFLTARYRENLSDDEGLANIVSSQLIQMNNPFVSETLAFAPRLNLADYLNAEFSSLNNIDYNHGFASVLYQDKRYFIMRIQVHIDGFSLKESQVVSQQLQTLFEQVIQTFDVDLVFSGVLFHTAESSAQAETEISTFGALSILGIVLLIFLVFRSLLPLTIAVVVMFLGIFYGFVAVLLFFKELHLLTLVFAVTLVGVVIDYCFHAFVYLNKFAKGNSQQVDSGVSVIIRPLTLGFITTALGYIALLFSPLTLLSQVAVFMVFGLFGALLSVFFVLPHVNRISPIMVMPAALQLSEYLKEKFVLFRDKRITIFTLCFVSLLLLLLKNPLSFNDDIRLLNSSPTWLLAQEKKVAEVLAYQGSQRIIIKEKSAQALLERQELTIGQLTNEQANLVINSFSGLLPSISLQRQNYLRIQTANDSGKFSAAIALTGLNDPIGSFVPLDLENYDNSSLGKLRDAYVTDYIVQDEAGIQQIEFALLMNVSGEKLNEKNIQWLKQQVNVSLFDKATDVSTLLSVYREAIGFLLSIAFCIVGIVLIARYGLKQGTLGFIATSLSALNALVITQLISGHLNIFNLLAVLLILALAIDYIIFYQEHGLRSRTLLAICLSAISSALAFGMLAFSTTPAVQGFGLTVMIGIVSVLVLSPFSSRRQLQ